MRSERYERQWPPADRPLWVLRLVPARPDDPVLGQVRVIAVSGVTLVDQVDIRKAEGDADHLQFIDQVVAPIALTVDETALLDAAAR